MRAKLFMLFVCVGAVLSAGCSHEAAKKRYIESGAAFLQAGHAPEAILDFLNAVELDPLWGEARYKLGEAYAASGEFDSAYRQYTRAADLMPEDVGAQLKAASYMLVVGQFEDARTRARAVLAKDPKNIDAQIVLGNAMAGLRDLEGAVAQLNDAIQLDPGRGQTYSNLALMKVAQGDWDAARSAFEQAVQADPTSIPARLALANFQWASGETAAAQQSLQQAYEQDKTHPITNGALAAFYRATGRLVDAERHLTFLASAATRPDPKFALADFYISSGRFADAQIVLTPLAREVSSAAGADARLAAIEYAGGRHEQAHKMLDQLIARQPNSAIALLLKARWLTGEGKPEQALDLARAAVAAGPWLLAAHYVRGLAEVSTNRTTDAIKSFMEVLRLNPRAAAAQVQLSNLHLIRHSYDTAVLFAEEALRNAPNSLDAHLALIRAWATRGEVRRARAALVELEKRADAAEIFALRGSIELREGDARAARTAFERALRIDGRSMEALQGITALDALENNVTGARARVQAQLAGGNEAPELLMLTAKVLVADRDLARAEDLLRRSIVARPLDTDNYALLGRVLQDLGTLDTARAGFDNAAASDPRDIGARLMSAMIVHTQGDLEEARRRYAEVLKIEPRAALAANNLAAILADAGENLDHAQALAQTAVDQMPASAEFQDTLGWIFYQRHLSGRAITRFEQSVAADPANPVYHYHLGLAYSMNGDRERARASLRRALDLNPGFGDATQALLGLGD